MIKTIKKKYLINLTKRIISKLLINDITGYIISKIKKNKINCYNLVIDTSNHLITNQVKASLFFNKYESAETRFLNKYLYDFYDVIELGSSLGVVTCQIRRKIGHDKKVIAVEANPFLIEATKLNLQFNNLDYNIKTYNKVIDYSTNKHSDTSFDINKGNLWGRIESNNSNPDNILVEPTTLMEIIKRFNLDEFVLFTDIEGAEAGIILNEKNIIGKCHQIIAELHDTQFENKYYTYHNLADLITEIHGLRIIDSYGPVYVFEK